MYSFFRLHMVRFREIATSRFFYRLVLADLKNRSSQWHFKIVYHGALLVIAKCKFLAFLNLTLTGATNSVSRTLLFYIKKSARTKLRIIIFVFFCGFKLLCFYYVSTYCFAVFTRCLFSLRYFVQIYQIDNFTQFMSLSFPFCLSFDFYLSHRWSIRSFSYPPPSKF